MRCNKTIPSFQIYRSLDVFSHQFIIYAKSYDLQERDMLHRVL